MIIKCDGLLKWFLSKDARFGDNLYFVDLDYFKQLEENQIFLPHLTDIERGMFYSVIKNDVFENNFNILNLGYFDGEPNENDSITNRTKLNTWIVVHYDDYNNDKILNIPKNIKDIDNYVFKKYRNNGWVWRDDMVRVFFPDEIEYQIMKMTL